MHRSKRRGWIVDRDGDLLHANQFPDTEQSDHSALLAQIDIDGRPTIRLELQAMVRTPNQDTCQRAFAVGVRRPR